MFPDDCTYEEVISITERVATLVLGIDASDRPSNKQVFDTVRTFDILADEQVWCCALATARVHRTQVSQ